MFNVLECIGVQHDQRLVAVAAGIWIIGSITLFLLLRRSAECVERRRRQWVAVAALAAGVGIWATHFVAMLAYRGIVPVGYNVGITALSVGVAVAFFWTALSVLGRRPTGGRSFMAGLMATLGVAAMHFTGMAAIIAPVRIAYDPVPIAVAALVGTAAFSASFIAFARMRGWWRITVPAAGAILAVVALHFTAMSATVMSHDPARGHIVAPQDVAWLVPAIVAATLGLILMVLAGALVDRLLTDMHGLTEASLEGLAIVSRGRIVEVNRRLAQMMGDSPRAMIGTAPDHWLEAADGHPITAERAASFEGRALTAQHPDEVLEIAVHGIEYRGRPCQVFAVRDLTERKRSQRQIEHMASHDSLTGLPNRAHLERVLDERIARGEGGFALLALDLDRFKAVNDVFGHAAGDEVLRRVAAILRDCARDGDLIARIGGDEFVMLQADTEREADAHVLARRVLKRFASDMDPARDPMAVGVSIGVAMFPGDGDAAESLRNNADVALYHAKEGGRGRVCFFNGEMDKMVRERRQLEHDLRQAMVQHQFRLAFQPLVSTTRGLVMGYEALIRWDHPERGEVPPETFIPVAEEIGAIVPIGEWVLREACRQAATWEQDLTIAVNVSPVQFQLANLAGVVRDAVFQAGLDPKRLELEVTESALLRNRATTLATLHEIKAMGVRIAMDDFGTGYSSLSNLQSFPFDKIKIDRSFVSSVTDDDAARSIVRAIVGLGRSLNLPVVAEGVETEAQRRMVMEEGCPQAQGFLYGEPTSVPGARMPQLRVVS
ncbi:EAL domain-containing protein [Sphingomonas sp. FW199]|uniref:bifunctional diguanylate cyclase/phosphodiesterase n=1 Tax=Sphingomonas sp. FW199 TaxID=3400217 RepID=UPI003CE78361